MSNLDVGFFNDPSVPYSAKLGATALMLRAVPHYPKRGVNKNIVVFETDLGLNSGFCPVFFDIGNADSIGNLNCKSKAQQISNEHFDCIGIIEGKYDDEKVAEMCAKEFKVRHKENFNDEALKDNIGPISRRLETYFDTWFAQDPTTFNPVVYDNAKKFISEHAIDVYNNGGVGKTARALREAQATQNDDKKKRTMMEAQAQA